MTTIPKVFRNAHGERLDHTFIPGDGRRGIVIIGHGVTSHKERPWLIALSDALGNAGIASLRISFSGNGESEGKFADSTISKEVADLRSVIDALGDQPVAYAGHSMGGAVGVLCAAADERIRALVCLAGMVHVHEFMQRHFGKLEPGELMFDKPECELSTELLDDAKAIGSTVEAGARVRAPWLLVHGTADDIVPLQDSLDIRDAASNRPELVQLPGVDHCFVDHEAEMTAAVVPWVARRFARD